MSDRKKETENNTGTDAPAKPLSSWSRQFYGWVEARRQRSNAQREAEILSSVTRLTEGERLLRLTQDAEIPLHVGGKLGRSTAFGQVSRDDEAGSIAIHVVNTGHVAGMTMTLHHELRHIEQQMAMGTLKEGWFGSIRNARTSHILSLMQEADAFTVETLAALHQRRDGQPEYLDHLLRHGGDVFVQVGKFLRDTPYESFPDDATFSRALFTDLMQSGLYNYSVAYFGHYQGVFLEADSLEKFKQKVAAAAPPMDPETHRPLTAPYGAGYMSSVPMTAVAALFFQAQPRLYRVTLSEIQKTVDHAETMTEEGYAAARTRVLGHTRDIYESEGPPPRMPRDILLRDFMKAASRAERPPTTEAIAKTLRQIQKPVVPR